MSASALKPLVAPPKFPRIYQEQVQDFCVHFYRSFCSGGSFYPRAAGFSGFFRAAARACLVGRRSLSRRSSCPMKPTGAVDSSYHKESDAPPASASGSAVVLPKLGAEPSPSAAGDGGNHAGEDDAAREAEEGQRRRPAAVP